MRSTVDRTEAARLIRAAICGSPRRRELRALESEPCQIKSVNVHIDGTRWIVFIDPIVHTLGKQDVLRSILPTDVPGHRRLHQRDERSGFRHQE
jgi:hypothetical protein